MEIELTREQRAVIDDADADLAAWNWQAGHASHWYVAGYVAGYPKKRVGLGRIIMERKIGRPLKANEKVCHIDGNPLNNRRANLTIAGRAWKHESEAAS